VTGAWRIPGLVACALLLQTALHVGPLGGVAVAASMADLRAQARAVGINPGSGGAAEEAALDRLGRVALAFLAAVEGNATGARETYEAIARPLEQSHDAHRAALGRLSQQVVDADGDMDALFESAGWLQHQALATQALYYLNWLRYQGAHLYSGSKRRELLGKAVAGFAEFASAGGESPIVIESHLGRGLANMELDQVKWAIADFEAVVQAKSAAPERKRKARLALADAYIRAGRSSDALAASEKALATAAAGDRARAQLTRARALLMAAASRSANKSRYQAQARDLLTTVKAGGGSWGRQADRMLRAGLDNPRIWAGPKAQPPAPPPPSKWDETKRLAATGKYKKAIPRLERMIASTDTEDAKHRREAQYLLGVARFKTGADEQAAVAFDAVLAGKGRAYYRDDAAYLRFKIKEKRYVADPSAERAPAYEAAIKEFLVEYPDHAAAPEVSYRLGEVRQRQEQCAAAIAAYAEVKGDPAFELRAAFGSAQCAVKALEQAPEGAARPDAGTAVAPEGADTDEAASGADEAASGADEAAPAADEAEVDPAALREVADASLARFWALIEGHDAGDFRDAPVAEMSGRSALLSAYLAALADPPDYGAAFTWVEGFEEKYPMLLEERPQVVKLRLAAATRLGRLDDVRTAAMQPSAGELDPAFLDHLSRRLLTASARQKARGKVDEAKAGKDAARLLAEHATASPRATELSPRVRYRLRSTLASLYEDAEEPERALALYRTLLAEDADAVSARAGAARVLEATGRASEARSLWDEVAAAPQGRTGWLEAHYQSARLSAELGETQRGCTLLDQLPDELLTNTNSPTPRKIQELRREMCQS